MERQTTSEAPTFDQQQMSRALRESESRLRSVVNSASMVLWAVDRNGIVTFSEGKALEGLGLKAGEVVGRSLSELYADVPQILEDNRRALAGEEFTSTVDLGSIIFESRYSPLRDDDGTITGVIGIGVDVTARKRAEEAQSQALSLLRATLESTADGILVVDSAGKITTFNRKFGEMWSIPQEVIDSGDDDRAIGHVLSQLREPEAFIERVRSLYANPEAESFDVVTFRDGRVFERFSKPQRIGETIVGRVWSFRDVTERRRSEEALRRRERQLEHTQRLTGLGSWEWTVASNNVVWSEELYRIYGVDAKNVPATFEGYLERVHPEDRERVAATIRNAVESGVGFDFVERIVRPDGEVRILRSQGEVIRDEAGDPIRLVGACHDITDQKAAETVLKRSHEEMEALVEARTRELGNSNRALEAEIAERQRAEQELSRRSAELEAIFHALPDLYFRLDGEGRILAHRSGSDSTLVLPTDSYIGETLHDLLPEEARATFDAGLREVAVTGKLFRLEYSLPFDNGERHFEARILPLAEGQVITIVRDITDRQRAELALRRSEEHYRRLIENSSDVATILGPDGINIYQSPSIRYVLGYSPDEMVGTSAFDRIHPEDVPKCREVLGEVMRNPGTTGTVEFRYRHKDGSWRVLEARARTLSPDTPAEGAVINSRDVTERKQYEDKLEAARDEAEKANRAKSEFLSRMSHELRTPMNSILGFGQLLERKDLPVDQRRSVEHILKAGRHLLNLINEVLEISRIESGRQNFSLEPVRVLTVLHEARALIQPLALQRDLHFEDHPVDPDLFVKSDRQRLVQVLLNLLSNAVKYNRPAGSLGILCEDTVNDAGKKVVRIGVHDTGEGLPAEKVERLFIPFERLGAEQDGVEGTGLGLALSKRLVEAMGGILIVESTPGEGSTFWVELEQVASPSASADLLRLDPAAPGTDPITRPPAKILYIEDNVANLALVETILGERSEIKLLSAVQGQIGLDLAVEHLPDLLLLDMHLPDIQGEEVLHRLRQDSRTCNIPVVVVSADATPATLRRLTAAGAAAYLTKPIDVAEFLTTIDRFLMLRSEAQ